jgi:hypothetical protein
VTRIALAVDELGEKSFIIEHSMDGLAAPIVVSRKFPRPRRGDPFGCAARVFAAQSSHQPSAWSMAGLSASACAPKRRSRSPSSSAISLTPYL